MPADDDAGVVSPKQQQVAVVEVVVSVDPVFQGQIGEDVVGLRDEDLSAWLLADGLERLPFMSESGFGNEKPGFLRRTKSSQ